MENNLIIKAFWKKHMVQILRICFSIWRRERHWGLCIWKNWCSCVIITWWCDKDCTLWPSIFQSMRSKDTIFLTIYLNSRPIKCKLSNVEQFKKLCRMEFLPKRPGQLPTNNRGFARLLSFLMWEFPRQRKPERIERIIFTEKSYVGPPVSQCKIDTK